MKDMNYKKFFSEAEINPMVCAGCKYVWLSRKLKPRQCPNCKRQIKYPKVGSKQIEKQ